MPRSISSHSAAALARRLLLRRSLARVRGGNVRGHASTPCGPLTVGALVVAAANAWRVAWRMAGGAAWGVGAVRRWGGMGGAGAATDSGGIGWESIGGMRLEFAAPFTQPRTSQSTATAASAAAGHCSADRCSVELRSYAARSRGAAAPIALHLLVHLPEQEHRRLTRGLRFIGNDVGKRVCAP